MLPLLLHPSVPLPLRTHLSYPSLDGPLQVYRRRAEWARQVSPDDQGEGDPYKYSTNAHFASKRVSNSSLNASALTGPTWA
jgi:hypothetical protein